jgi:hypothetical protein
MHETELFNQLIDLNHKSSPDIQMAVVNHSGDTK